MNKLKKLSENLGYQWERVKKWLRIFPVPPTKLLLLIILVPLPFLVIRAALKKFREKGARHHQCKKHRQDQQRKLQLTLSQRVRLLKALKKRRQEKERESERSREQKEISDKDV